MAYESIRREGWSNTVENQCHLLYAICADNLTCKIKRLCKWENLSEEKGWSLYGLEIIQFGDCETGVGTGHDLGSNVYCSCGHGFGIQKGSDKTF